MQEVNFQTVHLSICSFKKCGKVNLAIVYYQQAEILELKCVIVIQNLHLLIVLICLNKQKKGNNSSVR